MSSILSKLNRYWRIFATGLSFALFGVGGVIIGITLFLLLGLHFIAPGKLNDIARRVISQAFRLYIWFMKSVGLLTYEVIGLERLGATGPRIVIANHPSLLDVVFLIAILRNANCVVKEALKHNPFTKPPVTAAGFVSNASETFVEDCVSALNRGETLVVFPEGTRTEPGKPLKFLRGASNIAMYSKLPFSPVDIRCEPATLVKNEKWYQVPQTPPHFRFEFLEPLDVSDYVDENAMDSQNARAVTKYLEAFYQQQLALAV